MKRVAPILTSLFCVFAMFVSGCGKDAAQNAAPAPSASSPAPAAGTDALPPETDGDVAADPVLVTVNGKTLTRSTARHLIREMAVRQGVSPQVLDVFMARQAAQMEPQIVEQFVNQTLLESEAERLAIPVTQEEVDAVVTSLSQSLPEGMTMDRALAAQGVDLAELRKEIESNERVRKLCESKTESVEPATTAQIETFYNENTNMFTTRETVEASHILISCDEDADAEAQATAKGEAEAIRKQLEDGADFAKLAAEKSACPSKSKGGSLGVIGRGQMVPPFEEAAFSQEVGKIGPVVKTQFGYHVILVTDKQPAGVQSIEDVTEQIREHLTNQQREKLLSAYVDTLREQAKITYPQQAPESNL